jgi:hypothetical protein
MEYLDRDLEQEQKQKDEFWSCGIPSLTGVDVHFVFFDAAATGNQFNDAANVPADIPDADHWKPILEISADELLLPEIDDLKIIAVVSFEILFCPRSRTV